MKITVGHLKRIIREELTRTFMNEGVLADYVGVDSSKSDVVNKIAEDINKKLIAVFNQILKDQGLSSFFLVTDSGEEKGSALGLSKFRTNISFSLDNLKKEFQAYRKEGKSGNDLFDQIVKDKLKPEEIQTIVNTEYLPVLFEQLKSRLEQMGFSGDGENSFSAVFKDKPKSGSENRMVVKFDAPMGGVLRGFFVYPVREK